MKFLEHLANRRFGIEFSIPSNWSLDGDNDESAAFYDETNLVSWHLFFIPNVSLSLHPKHRDDLEQSLQYYARAMFEDCFRPNETTPKPRTADRSWSPMVEIEPCEISGLRALSMVHRMQYQPTLEMVMGHLLIPVQEGLFEARVIAGERMTGYRESILLALVTKDPDAPFPPQSYYDDPVHDAKFPEHSLTRVRRALRWLRTDATLRAFAAPKESPEGTVHLQELGCSLVPPPRFVRATQREDAQCTATFERCSFCGTDGLETFVVNVFDPIPNLDETRLEQYAVKQCNQDHSDSGVRDINIQATPLRTKNRSHAVLVVVEGLGNLGKLRNVFLWFMDEMQRPWNLAIIATAAVPVHVWRDELELARTTWELKAKPKRSWWKFW